MEEMISLWGCQETDFENSFGVARQVTAQENLGEFDFVHMRVQKTSDIDKLNQKHMYAVLELEKSKLEASEETGKIKEYMKQLIHLLNITIQERDEARNQLQKLLEKFMSTSSIESLNIAPHFRTDDPLVKTGKANSSITESNSFSEVYNYQSHGSSPADSLFDAVSPEISKINMLSTNQVTAAVPKIDHASLIIDNLARGRVLPQTGKFLEAVRKAGPLLQTLLVAGSLPSWRNPPRFQPFQIPPAPKRGYDNKLFVQKPTLNLGQLVTRSHNSQPFAQMSCGSAQILPTSILNFANVLSESGFHNGVVTSTDANNCIPLAKRRSFQWKFNGELG